MVIRPAQLIAAFGFGCAFIGSFLPWIKLGIFSKAGTQGDGVLTLILAGVGGLLILCAAGNIGRLLALVAAAAIVAITIYEGIDIANRIDDLNQSQTLIQVDWANAIGEGLVLSFIGGAVAFFASLYAGDDAPGREGSRLLQCSTCSTEVFRSDQFCPECGADFRVRRRYRRSA